MIKAITEKIGKYLETLNKIHFWVFEGFEKSALCEPHMKGLMVDGNVRNFSVLDKCLGIT